MPPHHTRRNVLTAGASAFITALAGCGDQPRTNGTTAVTDGGIRTDRNPDTTTERRARAVQQRQLGASTAAVVVGKTQDEVLAIDGRTREQLASGPAGEADGRVLRAGLQRLGEGGRMFIHNATYTVDTPSDRTADGALFLDADEAQVLSDFATIRFGDHTLEQDVQKDLKLFGLQHGLIAGLILDGDRTNRGTPTITLNVSESRDVTVRDCVLYGGSAGTSGDRGYGVGLSRSRGFTMTNCVVRDADRHGIHPGGQPDARTRDVTIRACGFFGNGVTPTGSAIDIRSHSHACRVVDCYFEANGRAIKIKGPDVRHVRVAGNVFRDNYVGGTDERGQLRLETGANATGLVITDNEFLLTEAPPLTAHLRYGFRAEQGTIEITANRIRGGTAGLLGAGNATVETFIVSDNTIEGTEGPFTELRRIRTLVLRDNTFRRDENREPGSVNVRDTVDRGMIRDNVLVNGDLNGVGEQFDVAGNARFD